MVNFLRYGTWPIIWLIVITTITLATDGFWSQLGTEFLKAPFSSVFAVILLYGTWRISVKGFRHWYAHKQGKHLIALKILLPRQETKIDQEKRTEKDFKEKIAIMEQLFRALWEIKSLNFFQMLHFWFFRFISISFEMYV